MTLTRLEVIETGGRRAVVEARVRRDTVEWWLGRRCLAAVDRQALERWLSDPRGDLVSGDLELSASPWGIVMAAQGQVLPSPMSPVEVADLRDRLAGRR
jgi:hypothetical protein